MADDHVQPQNAGLRNSPKTTMPQEGPAPSGPNGAAVSALAGTTCFWNGAQYSDGGTVCDSHQRYKCWSGKWVDIGNC